MVEALFTILGTILGFVLSELAQIRREKQNERKQATSVRTLINLEVDLNLRSLLEFWSNVNQIEKKDEDIELHKQKLARRFIDLPLPEFQTRSFERQLHLIAASLNEQEVTQLFQFYDRLSRIETLREKLALFAREQKAEWDLASGGSNMVPIGRSFGMAHKFSTNASSLWDESESLIAQLIAKGNPLKIR